MMPRCAMHRSCTNSRSADSAALRFRVCPCRLQVLAYLPNLRTLDFIAATKVDRDRARVWYEAKLKRRG